MGDIFNYNNGIIFLIPIKWRNAMKHGILDDYDIIRVSFID